MKNLSKCARLTPHRTWSVLFGAKMSEPIYYDVRLQVKHKSRFFIRVF